MPTKDSEKKMPDDLQRCVEFHGHICPGLIYGYRVAQEAMKLMDLRRSADEEVVAICENDSCAIDALQVMLGTVAGKGNLIIKDFGKNAYTVLNRAARQAYRFSRKTRYDYTGKDKHVFDRLEAAVAGGQASEDERRKLKRLKVFRTEAVRSGFKAAWAARDYHTIVSVAQKLPEDVLQEDLTILQYYDNASMRVAT